MTALHPQKLSDDFDAVKDKKPPRTLYHAIPGVPVGEVLEARTTHAVVEGSNGPFLFAATHFSKSLAFCFDYRSGEILMNAGIEGTDAELAVVVDRDNTIGKSRTASVFSFFDDGSFRDIKGARQCVSEKNIPFSQTQKVLEIKSAEDLMKVGLQIFSFKETLDELGGDKFIDVYLRDSGVSHYQWLGNMIKEGKVIWENKERGINPHPVLEEKLHLHQSHQPKFPEP